MAGLNRERKGIYEDTSHKDLSKFCLHKVCIKFSHDRDDCRLKGMLIGHLNLSILVIIGSWNKFAEKLNRHLGINRLSKNFSNIFMASLEMNRSFGS